MQPWKRAGLTREQSLIAKLSPGLLDLDTRQARILYDDDHSLFHGEAKRLRRLGRFLREQEVRLGTMGYKPAVMHASMQQRLHDFYVGDIESPERQTMPMYWGNPASFEENAQTFRAAVRDVEHIYAHLTKLLPEEITLKRKSFELRRMAKLDDDVRIDDPLELLRLSKVGDRHIRHQARCRLILAQACFEARRDGYAPETLRRFEQSTNEFLGRHFFEDQEGEFVHIVAELDPADRYLCRSYEVIEDGKPVPEPTPTRFVMSASRHTVPRRRGKSGRPLQIFFFVRHKQRMMLKLLDRKIRFTDLIGIGDPIAMMFVVERDDLRRLVSEVREVIVPCPGMVADLNSSIGHRLGSERLDPRNKRSSKLYEAMKYVARMQDRMVEMQFLPMAAWINAKASKCDVNHNAYKLGRYLQGPYPTLFPTSWTGIPWSDPALRRQCIAYALHT